MITIPRKHSKDFYQNGMDKSYVDVFRVICETCSITLTDGRFVYFLDEECTFDSTRAYRYENLTPAYDFILKAGVEDFAYKSEEIGQAATSRQKKFCQDYNQVLQEMGKLADRIVLSLEEQKPVNWAQKADWFRNLRNGLPRTFEEAIQRMLFVNQLFWQTDHRLTGLGAWDDLLYPYYKADMEAGRLDKNGAKAILDDLVAVLHEYYTYKSNVLMGDTGQIFVLGKSDSQGRYICNDLTYLIIQAVKDSGYPDPKVLLRINKDTPEELLKISLDCIRTGIGSPLFANDEVIIPCLRDFGVPLDDACQYNTSACWEPLIGGMSSTNNNMAVLNFMKSFDNLLWRENLSQITTYEAFVRKYLEYLRRNMAAVKRVLDQIVFQYNPLLSIFMKDCRENMRDVSEGGARYHNNGITSVALGNTINALLNVKEFVYDKNELSLVEIKAMLADNFEGNEKQEEWRKKLTGKPSRYARDEEEIMALANRITETVSACCKDYSSYIGGHLKFGLSGSAYLDVGRTYHASFDGRKAGEPFNVHISNEDNVAYTEIVNFAGGMDYSGNRFNGNVIDFMVNPDYLRKNSDKFVLFIQAAVESGFFEMQMNVVSSEVLLDAREHPENHTGLIVRVWGFSSFFNDLPEEYKDVLIRRALKNEGKVA